MQALEDSRIEHDLLGDRAVPSECYYGVHTLRAVENFPVSGTPISRHPDLIVALACVKQAAALATTTSACWTPPGLPPSSQRARRCGPDGSTTSSSWTSSRAGPALRRT